MSNTSRAKRKYDSTAPHYEEVTYGGEHKRLYQEIRLEQICETLRRCRGALDSLRVLEVACGTGTVAEGLVRHGVGTLVAIDGSRAMLREFVRRRPSVAAACSLSVADAGRLPFPDATFDAVIATRFIHLFSHGDKKRLFAEFWRVLKEGGVCLVEFYGRPYHWVRYYACRLYRTKDRDRYFEHYPTLADVKDIVPGPFDVIPVRLAFSRCLLPLMGRDLLKRLTKRIPCAVYNPLIDEYVVLARKPEGTIAG